MGHWANTTYVRHGDVEAVADALTRAFECEDMQAIAAPPQRSRHGFEPLQDDDALHNDLWALAAFPGAPGWVVVQTAPTAVLSERAPGADHPRLVDVARDLRAHAFQLHVYDGSLSMLVEVSPEGEWSLSGVGNGRSDQVWLGERLDATRYELQFRWLPFADLLASEPYAEYRAYRFAELLGGTNAAHCDNLVSIDTLICHKPFAVAGASVRYFRWKGPSRERFESTDSFEACRAGLAKR